VSDALNKALQDGGPHSAESLADRLPHFPLEAIRQALELLATQGVLERVKGAEGEPLYRYVAPELYAQVNLDVIRDPGKAHNRRPR